MFNANEISFEESLIQLRFVGDELNNKSIPIYDLGVSLITVQRIVHKAYLAQQGSLEDTNQLTEQERLLLSLQISSRKKSSDGYGLIPFLTNDSLIKSIEIILPIVFNALGQYVMKRIEARKTEPEGKTDQEDETKSFDEQLFTGSIYAEVVQVAERIENKGVIKQIELSTTRKIEQPKLKFDADTKEYLKSLKDHQVFGRFQDVGGKVNKIDDVNNIVEVKISARRVIKVHLTDNDFEIVRYGAKRYATIIFSGVPILLLGQNRYKAFEAHYVKVLDK
jgi:hypothetical protein